MTSGDGSAVGGGEGRRGEKAVAGVASLVEAGDATHAAGFIVRWDRAQVEREGPRGDRHSRVRRAPCVSEVYPNQFGSNGAGFRRRRW